MARYYGAVGYATSRLTAPGVYEDTIEERFYRGDILKNTSRWQRNDYLNDDLNISNRISILADPYAYENFSKIKYVVWMCQKWKVSEIEVQRPRLILTIGGVYNGPEA